MINKKAPNFEEEAYVDGQIKKIRLSDYENKWLILFFYPADFTFVCPTELGELAAKDHQFKELGSQIISISTDTAYVHMAWHDQSKIVNTVKFPMLSDPAGRVSRAYGTYQEDKGLSFRATYLIDPDGIIQAYEFHTDNIGRSSDELLRKLQAAKFVRENKGELCPMNWKPGAKTLKPSAV